MSININYISDINSDFQNAIKAIKESEVIAVDCEGDQFGRNGKLCLVQVATESNVFLFDVIHLGEDLFNQGLRTIFETGTVTKVFYDSRGDSDILYHNFGIRLKGIIDVALTEVYYRYRCGMGIPRFLKGYRKCVEMYLPNTDPRFHELKSKMSVIMTERGTSLWRERPLSKEALEYAAYDVKYLRDLHIMLSSTLTKDDVKVLKRGSNKFHKMARNNSEPSSPDARVPSFFNFYSGSPIQYQYCQQPFIQSSTIYQQPLMIAVNKPF